MSTAFWYMVHLENFNLTSRQYENLNIEQRAYSSLVNTGRFCGDKNPTKRPEVGKKISKTHRERGVSKGKNNPNYGGVGGSKGHKWQWTEEQKEELKKVRKKQKPYVRGYTPKTRKWMIHKETLKQIIVDIKYIDKYIELGYYVGRLPFKKRKTKRAIDDD